MHLRKNTHHKKKFSLFELFSISLLCVKWQTYFVRGKLVPKRSFNLNQFESLNIYQFGNDLISKFNDQIVWVSTRMRWMTHCIGKLETDFESNWNVFMLCNIYPFIQQLSNSRVVTCTNAPLLVTQWGEILSEEALLFLCNCVFTKYSWLKNKCELLTCFKKKYIQWGCFI